ncbi:hypothetical protein HK105_206355 [Polyrhizophydium stewartii]|uniref:Ankyrin repeat protein n=1 Tax=Polyrhizophydium stewartii TaxID=2732419 RepID=A0ABR4N3I0_9FUNG
MDSATYNGHIDCIQWLHDNRIEGCKIGAMDCAVENGHLDVLKWLHVSRTEGCTQWAVLEASPNGHADVVEWLHMNRRERNIAIVAMAAAHYGRLGVVQRTYRLAPYAITPDVANEAAAMRSMDVLEWIVDSTRVRPTPKLVSLAVDMLLWFRRRIPGVFYTPPLSKVGRGSADSVIEWFDRADLPHSQDLAQLAIGERQSMVTKWLLHHLPETYWREEDLRAARGLAPSE